MLLTKDCQQAVWKACFPAARPREADFLWEGGRGPWETAQFAVFHGWGPAFHRTIRARARAAPLPHRLLGAEGGLGGDFGAVDSATSKAAFFLRRSAASQMA